MGLLFFANVAFAEIDCDGVAIVATGPSDCGDGCRTGYSDLSSGSSVASGEYAAPPASGFKGRSNSCGIGNCCCTGGTVPAPTVASCVSGGGGAGVGGSSSSSSGSGAGAGTGTGAGAAGGTPARVSTGSPGAGKTACPPPPYTPSEGGFLGTPENPDACGAACGRSIGGSRCGSFGCSEAVFNVNGFTNGAQKCCCYKRRLTGSATSTAAFLPELANPFGTEYSIPKLVGKTLRGFMGILGVIAMVIFIYGGFLWMISLGDETRVKKGRETMIWAGMGLIAIVGSYVVIQFILDTVLAPPRPIAGAPAPVPVASSTTASSGGATSTATTSSAGVASAGASSSGSGTPPAEGVAAPSPGGAHPHRL